jgi:hypothetical protein
MSSQGLLAERALALGRQAPAQASEDLVGELAEVVGAERRTLAA